MENSILQISLANKIALVTVFLSLFSSINAIVEIPQYESYQLLLPYASSDTYGIGVNKDGTKISQSPFASLTSVKSDHSDDTFMREIFQKSTQTLKIYQDFLELNLTGWPLEVQESYFENVLNPYYRIEEIQFIYKQVSLKTSTYLQQSSLTLSDEAKTFLESGWSTFTTNYGELFASGFTTRADLTIAIRVNRLDVTSEEDDTFIVDPDLEEAWQNFGLDSSLGTFESMIQNQTNIECSVSSSGVITDYKPCNITEIELIAIQFDDNQNKTVETFATQYAAYSQLSSVQEICEDSTLNCQDYTPLEIPEAKYTYFQAEYALSALLWSFEEWITTKSPGYHTYDDTISNLLSEVQENYTLVDDSYTDTSYATLISSIDSLEAEIFNYYQLEGKNQEDSDSSAGGGLSTKEYLDIVSYGMNLVVLLGVFSTIFYCIVKLLKKKCCKKDEEGFEKPLDDDDEIEQDQDRDKPQKSWYCCKLIEDKVQRDVDEYYKRNYLNDGEPEIETQKQKYRLICCTLLENKVQKDVDEYYKRNYLGDGEPREPEIQTEKQRYSLICCRLIEKKVQKDVDEYNQRNYVDEQVPKEEDIKTGYSLICCRLIQNKVEKDVQDYYQRTYKDEQVYQYQSQEQDSKDMVWFMCCRKKSRDNDSDYQQQKKPVTYWPCCKPIQDKTQKDVEEFYQRKYKDEQVQESYETGQQTSWFACFTCCKKRDRQVEYQDADADNYAINQDQEKLITDEGDRKPQQDETEQRQKRAWYLCCKKKQQTQIQYEQSSPSNQSVDSHVVEKNKGSAQKVGGANPALNINLEEVKLNENEQQVNTNTQLSFKSSPSRRENLLDYLDESQQNVSQQQVFEEPVKTERKPLCGWCICKKKRPQRESPQQSPRREEQEQEQVQVQAQVQVQVQEKVLVQEQRRQSDHKSEEESDGPAPIIIKQTTKKTVGSGVTIPVTSDKKIKPKVEKQESNDSNIHVVETQIIQNFENVEKSPPKKEEVKQEEIKITKQESFQVTKFESFKSDSQTIQQSPWQYQQVDFTPNNESPKKEKEEVVEKEEVIVKQSPKKDRQESSKKEEEEVVVKEEVIENQEVIFVKQKTFENVQSMQKVIEEESEQQSQISYEQRKDHIIELPSGMIHQDIDNYTGYGKQVNMDDDVYVGDFKQGKYHGKGKLEFFEGGYYEGEFQDGEFVTGQVFIFIDDDTSYQQPYLNNKIQGKILSKDVDGHSYRGEIFYTESQNFWNVTWFNGATYEGKMTNSKFHGKGKLIYLDKRQYTGDFVEGRIEGQGEFIWPDDKTYQGEFKNDLFDGTGVMKWKDNKIYTGQFKKDLYHGQGNIKYTNGDNYIGQFKEGLYSGQGRFVFANGDVYQGSFENDLYNGEGELKIQATGESFKGGFKDGFKDGQGQWVVPKKWSYNGQIQNDEFNGVGKINWEDGNSYEGNFKNGKQDGDGVFKWANGNTLSGLFVDGVIGARGALNKVKNYIYEGEFKQGKKDGLGIIKYFDNDKNQNPGGFYEGQFQHGKKNGSGKEVYKDKKTYYGQFKDNKFHGKGQLVFPDGAGYDGDFQNNLYHGKGIQTWANGTKYEGQFKDNQKEGKGKMTYPTGEYYVGDFQSGQYHGNGSLIWPDGEIYTGQWVQSMKQGKGEEIFVDGSKYTGEYLNNEFHGQGILIWSDGSKYEGQFDKNKKNGKGIQIWNDGRRYEGDFKDDMFSGKGHLIIPDGSEYTGDFLMEDFHGYGIYKFSNGQVYKGEYKNDMRDGKGTYTYPNGDNYEGDFKDNLQEGQGIFKWANGQKYEGSWKADKQHGQGLLTMEDGTTYRSQFEDDQPVGRVVITTKDGIQEIKNSPHKATKR